MNNLFKKRGFLLLLLLIFLIIFITFLSDINLVWLRPLFFVTDDITAHPEVVGASQQQILCGGSLLIV